MFKNWRQDKLKICKLTTRCPEELASSVGMPHPLHMFYGNLVQWVKSQIGDLSIHCIDRFAIVLGTQKSLDWKILCTENPGVVTRKGVVTVCVKGNCGDLLQLTALPVLGTQKPLDSILCTGILGRKG